MVLGVMKNLLNAAHNNPERYVNQIGELRKLAYSWIGA
jgi:hypothetical protein